MRHRSKRPGLGNQDSRICRVGQMQRMGQFNGNEPLKELISRQPDFAELALTQLSSELVSIKLRDRPINGVRKETIEAMDDGLDRTTSGMFLQQYVSVCRNLYGVHVPRLLSTQ